MREKIVRVTTVHEVSMWHSASHGGVVAFEANGDHWPESDWTPAMHAAAEELRAQGAELGENQWRCPDGGIATVRRCGIGNVEFDGPMPGTGFSYPICGDKLGEVLYGEGLHDFACAYHLKHYTLLPDECREQGKPPRKMVDGEVRLANGEPVQLIGDANPYVRFDGQNGGDVFCWLFVTGERAAESPFNDLAQYARGLAWWIKNAPADLCLTDDGRSVRTMATNEVRDVVTGKGLMMRRFGLHEAHIGTESWRWRIDWEPEKECRDHPCSLPSNRLRVEAFLKDHGAADHESAVVSHAGDVQQSAVGAALPIDGDATVQEAAVLPEAHSGSPSGELSAPCRCGKCPGYRFTPDGKAFDRDCPTCNGTGTGRKTEESDGKTEEAHGGQRSSTSVQPVGQHDHRCQSTPSHLQEVSGDPGVGEAQQAAASKVRPLGVPASATIWAEVEVVKRCAAWFEPRKNQWCPDGVVLDNPTGGNFWTPENSDKHWHPQTAAQCRQLYEKGLAHLAAEATHQALAPEPVGDGVTDDTEALQHLANTGRSLKPGVYRVTRTLEETAQAFDARGLGNLFDEGAEPESLEVIMLRVELDIANDSASRWEQVARDLAERIKSGGAP